MTQPTASKHWRRVASCPDSSQSHQAHLTMLQWYKMNWVNSRSGSALLRWQHHKRCRVLLLLLLYTVTQLAQCDIAQCTSPSSRARSRLAYSSWTIKITATYLFTHPAVHASPNISGSIKMHKQKKEKVFVTDVDYSWIFILVTFFTFLTFLFILPTFFIRFLILSNTCRPARQSIVTVVCVSICNCKPRNYLW